MIPVAVTVGNILFTIWIVGGFVAILLLTRDEESAAAQQGIRIPPSTDAEPKPERPGTLATVSRLDLNRDVYWERHPGWLDTHTREAA